MPITKSAAKALRRDKRRQLINQKIRSSYKTAVKKARQNPTKENLRQAYSVLDRAAKKKVIHRNKAARLKSRLTKKTPKKKTSAGKKKQTSKKSS